MARYAVLGEDSSDAQTLQVLIRRIACNEGLTVKPKGYDGCGELLRKGARDLNDLLDQGYDRFVVAYDSDGRDPVARCAEAHRGPFARRFECVLRGDSGRGAGIVAVGRCGGGEQEVAGLAARTDRQSGTRA